MNDTLKYLLVIVVIVALGVLALNQFFSYRYKVYFIKQPCNLCLELNPQLEPCFISVQTTYTNSPANNPIRYNYTFNNNSISEAIMPF